MQVHEIYVGYHLAGYRIDKTTTPMNRYTQWTILDDGGWANPRPVCFHALPEEGWMPVASFVWPEAQEKAV
jgi:hypothetical protein